MRIGLIGFNCASGLGTKNIEMAKHLPIERWLVVPHKSYKTLSPPEGVDPSIIDYSLLRKRRNESVDKYLKRFVDQVDVVLFDETPYYKQLVDIAKDKGKRVVCILCMEWTPVSAAWLKKVNLFICPTMQAYRIFRAALPCKYFPWPVDTKYFTFKHRTKCNRFVFINGRGGWHGRKGGQQVAAAKSIWPEMPLIVWTQTKTPTWPPTTDVRGAAQDRRDLYKEGDVLLCPHAVDGTGLEPLEAAASGMPVISTDGEPWNEYPQLDKLPATKRTVHIACPVEWHDVDYREIVRVCKKWLGKDITDHSLLVRDWAVGRSWRVSANRLAAMIRGEK